MQMIKVYHTRPERRTRRSLYFQNGASNCLVTAQLLQNAPCVIIFSHHLHNYRNNPFFTKLNCQRNSFHENNLSNCAQLYSTSRGWSDTSDSVWVNAIEAVHCTLPRTKSGISVDWSLSSASRARIRLPRKPSLAPFTSSGLEISRWRWHPFV